MRKEVTASFPVFLGRFGTVLRYALSITALVWLAAHVPWSQLSDLSQVNMVPGVAALLLAGIAYPLQALRWQRLLAAQAIHPPAAWVHAAFWMGNFYNSFLPGGIAGDGMRLVHAWHLVPDRKAGAATSIIEDRLIGMAALLLLTVLAIGVQLVRKGENFHLQSLFAASFAALGLLVAVSWLASRPGLWHAAAARWFGAERATQLSGAVSALGKNRSVLITALGLSLAVWIVDFAALWLLARSVGLSISPLETAVAASAAYVAASLPISIGGHGVREATLVALLGWLGVGSGQPETVLLLALAFWTVSTSWSLVGGVVYLVAASGKARISAR